MYFEYLKEIEGMESFIGKEFFISYKIRNNLLFICDLYIKPEFRVSSISYKVFKTIKRLVKNNNCSIIEITMDQDHKNYERNLIIYYRLGFRIIGTQGTINHLRMEA